MNESVAVVKDVSVPRWLILLTVIIGTFLGRLDQTIAILALKIGNVKMKAGEKVHVEA